MSSFFKGLGLKSFFDKSFFERQLESLDKESYNFLEKLVESGKYNWEDIKKRVKIEDGGIIWEGDLYIEGTKVKKIKVKGIKGNINACLVETLEEIEVEEEIGGSLYIRGTKVKKIKAKGVKGNIDATWVETLEEIEVEEIGGDLDIRRTKVKKIKAKRVKWNIRAWGVETLEKIEVEEIGGDLDIRGTSVDFQLEIIDKINKKELKVKRGLFKDEEIIGLFVDDNYKLKSFSEIKKNITNRYGNSFDKIEDKILKKEIIHIFLCIKEKLIKDMVEYANKKDKEGIKKVVKEISNFKDLYESFMKDKLKF